MNKDIFKEDLYRVGTSSIKWDFNAQMFGSDDILPMWIADSDLPTAPCITEALQKRAAHPAYGYAYVPDSYWEAANSWYERRQNIRIKRDWCVDVQGGVTALKIALDSFCEPGDRVIVCTPAYHRFFDTVTDRGCILVQVPLLSEPRYQHDLEALEREFSRGCRLAIFANPNNPTGRSWDRNEIVRFFEYAERADSIVFADEVFSDVLLPPNVFHSALSLPERLLIRTILLHGPSKTFNLSGLQISNVVIPDERLRRPYVRTLELHGNEVPTVFAHVAGEAAFRGGEEWLTLFNAQLTANVEILSRELAECPLTIIKPEGSFLMWIDFRKLKREPKELNRLLMEKGKLGLYEGSRFGPGGAGFFRLNLACSQQRILDAASRIKTALSTIS